MKKLKVFLLLFAVVLFFNLCKKIPPFADNQYDTRLSGGSATVFLSNAKAYGEAINGLSDYDKMMHDLGDIIFNQTFVSAPAPLYGGLGPIYNNVSCVSCHHNDGKGAPTIGLINSSILARISLDGSDANNDALPIPNFGTQIQDKAIAGITPEAKVTINYTEETFTFPDGETAILRKPNYTVHSAYQALPASFFLSIRSAPSVFGLGLLALIPEHTLLSFADPDDANGDGISGRINYVYNSHTRQTEIGRFGLKANSPSILLQSAAAFHQDMGITNYIFSKESAWGQQQNDGRNDDPEIADSILNATAFYIQTLAVPARRGVEDKIALQGEKIFHTLNCSGCHKSNITTGTDVRIPSLSNQRIHPYTDLLLHDMGPELADNRPDFMASGSEWRTTPLWGIGLLLKVTGTESYLHDGRAKTLTEAILWHGGEALNAKNQFVQLSKQDRAALIKFLQSL